LLIFGDAAFAAPSGGHDGGREAARMTGRSIRLFGRGPARRAESPAPGPERAVVPLPGLAPVLTIDALGRKCPIPIIMLAEQIRDVPLGAVVAVLADDPAAYTDIPSWCVMKAQEFAGYTELPRGWALFIRRAI
jgi:tRNA 2-thiouridine synthesizing protein A